jgi:hypothetical protein
MIRVTPLRFTTLQCSQIGLTLVRTFTGAPDNSEQRVFGQTLIVTEVVSSIKGMGWTIHCPTWSNYYSNAALTAAIAAARSGAAVTIRPTTTYVAPAVAASPGVTTRAWS